MRIGNICPWLAGALLHADPAVVNVHYVMLHLMHLYDFPYCSEFSGRCNEKFTVGPAGGNARRIPKKHHHVPGSKFSLLVISDHWAQFEPSMEM
jgi:hypothetical protein